ncbi:hypothetical protein RB195_015702 [Necator americanus]|uniref:Major facilitator superfamily (MFS) profile domain-containing protein n=1 Tax=Necator americanus TaxID=51031 RepID=A0ABR1E5X4_NECAM
MQFLRCGIKEQKAVRRMQLHQFYAQTLKFGSDGIRDISYQVKEADTLNMDVESEFKQLEEVSSNERMNGEKDERAEASREVKVKDSKEKMTCGMIIKMSTLICINLLNYMDRFTIAGVLTNIQAFFEINDADAGLLQSSFMVFFMFCSPVCGFLGDRYNRKWIMVVGIAIWVFAVFGSTFVPKEKFVLFLLLRGVVGVGEASYATISPSIIADMFTGPSRSRMLMIFYFAIPLGSGLGFIVGSNVAALTGHWTWGVRVTVFLGVICLAMIIIFIEEPERGAVERVEGREKTLVATSYWNDIVALAKTPTYVLSTAGYTAIVFMVGTLSWWAATTIEHSEANKLGLNSTALLDPKLKARVSLVFGAITCAGGLFGVGLGSTLSMLLRTGYGPFKAIQTVRSDAIICGVGALIGVPTLFLSLHLIPINMPAAWAFMFTAITVTCFNWATNVDMLMDVVIPTRRNAANSWQILLSHMFGDASGPYIVGIISDHIRGDDSSPAGNFRSLVISFHLPNAILLLGAVLFFCAAYTFVRDNNKFKEHMGIVKPAPEPPGSEMPLPSAPTQSDESERKQLSATSKSKESEMPASTAPRSENIEVKPSSAESGSKESAAPPPVDEGNSTQQKEERHEAGHLTIPEELLYLLHKFFKRE